MSQKAIVDELFSKVVGAMQGAEEIGGPDDEGYQLLMGRIADEALKRASAHRAHAFAKPPALDADTVHGSLLKECFGVQWLAQHALEKGATDEAMLHLSMLNTYMARAANHPVMLLSGADMWRIVESLNYHFNLTECVEEDIKNKELIQRLSLNEKAPGDY